LCSNNNFCSGEAFFAVDGEVGYDGNFLVEWLLGYHDVSTESIVFISRWVLDPQEFARNRKLSRTTFCELIIKSTLFAASWQGLLSCPESKRALVALGVIPRSRYEDNA
jgi:hypothetical protein